MQSTGADDKGSSSTNLSPNAAGLLCYVGGWVSGFIFLIVEQKNKWVRFHAAQSVIVFGALSILFSIFNQIPIAGWFFGVVFAVLALVLWITLMVRAYRGKLFKLPIASDLAVRLLGMTEKELAELIIEFTSSSPAEKSVERSASRWENNRPGRIVGSGVAIGWSLALLIFFNFFNQYIADYNKNNEGTWVLYPILNDSFSAWLPILNAALILSILGHVLMITFDRRIIREATQLVLDIFSIAVIASLFSIFPFDFSSLNNVTLANGIEFSIRLTLGIIAFGIGIGVIVRFVRLIVSLVKPGGS